MYPSLPATGPRGWLCGGSGMWLGNQKGKRGKKGNEQGKEAGFPGAFLYFVPVPGVTSANHCALGPALSRTLRLCPGTEPSTGSWESRSLPLQDPGLPSGLGKAGFSTGKCGWGPRASAPGPATVWSDCPPCPVSVEWGKGEDRGHVNRPDAHRAEAG